MSKKNNRRKGGNIRKKKAANATAAAELQDSNTTNKVPCKFHLEGKCRFGDECKFSHYVSATSLPPSDTLEVFVEANGSEVEVKDGEESISGTTVTSTTAAGVLEPEDKKDAVSSAATASTTPTKQSRGPLRSVLSSMTSIITSPFSASKSNSSLPLGLESSLSLFTPSQQELAKALCRLPGSTNQVHLFEHWSTSEKTDDDEKKKAFMSKLEEIDQSYPDGGLIGYLKNATVLLEKSRRGENPLEGWSPSVPQGETFTVGTDDFMSTEALGLKEVGKCGFVLVAGGLGERLGYGDIKIGLPTELATGTPYIQFYIETILAFQSRYAAPGEKLPLCIMTSCDTNNKTVALLSSNNYFGMEKNQITIVQQGQGVPAVYNNDAHIALESEDSYNIQMKPHGHGDIHALMHSHGVAKSWLEKGTKWTVFFQDTNGLAFNTLPLSLGVSSKLGLIMNSITCPRKAKQAIGAIVKLEKGTMERTINVEYNQLDPLLRATGHDDGDVNDETGFSPYPGNINQLVFNLGSYVQILERTKGIMPEFVNPKYKDAEKTTFKKPTRLECMMQDFPTVLEGDEVKCVGFTSLASELCFSPVKNSTSDGVALQMAGTHPGVAATGEADQSYAICTILRSLGCCIEEGSKIQFNGIIFSSGPDCVLKPSFAACANEMKKKFPYPSGVKISGKSSLVLSGSGLVIESLDLDGALVVDCEDGASGVIRDLVVKNKGWVKVANTTSKDEFIQMRGYSMSKLETEKIVFKKDGSIEGNYSKNATGPIDLSKPAHRELADVDTLCGNSCSVM